MSTVEHITTGSRGRLPHPHAAAHPYAATLTLRQPTPDPVVLTHGEAMGQTLEPDRTYRADRLSGPDILAMNRKEINRRMRGTPLRHAKPAAVTAPSSRRYRSGHQACSHTYTCTP